MPSGWEKAPEYGGTGGRVSTAAAVMAVAILGAGLANCSIEAAKEKEAASTASSEIAGVASVVDGDTIEIRGQRIRLSGFDTPERDARCGDTNVYQQAALALSDFIAQRTVSCTPRGSDDHDRIVASCSVGGTDLGDYMVSQGWGRDWPRYSGGAYADEEAAARAVSRGLWGLRCPPDLWGGRNYSR